MPALLLLLLSAAEPRLVAVPDATFTGPSELRGPVNEAVAGQVRTVVPQGKIFAAADLARVLASERQRQLLGCEQDGDCMAEISAALNADEIVSASVTLLHAGITGREWGVTISRVGRNGSRLKSVSTTVCGDAVVLVETIQATVDAAFGLRTPGRGRACAPGAAVGGAVAGGVLMAAGAVGLGLGLSTKAAWDAQQLGGVATVSRADAQVAQILFVAGIAAAAVGLATVGLSTFFLLREPPPRVALLPVSTSGLFALNQWWR